MNDSQIIEQNKQIIDEFLIKCPHTGTWITLPTFYEFCDVYQKKMVYRDDKRLEQICMNTISENIWSETMAYISEIKRKHGYSYYKFCD